MATAELLTKVNFDELKATYPQTRIKCVVVGMTPLVMNNGMKADPDSEFVAASADLRTKKKKSVEDRKKLERLEFEGGLYYDDEIGPYLPSENIYKALIEGGRITKNGKDIAALVSIEEPKVKLYYKGSREIEGLWKAGLFLRCMVSSNGKPGGPKVARVRPRFDPGWQAGFTILVDTEIDADTVVQALKDAGRRVGLCERKMYRWGRFAVVDVKTE